MYDVRYCLIYVLTPPQLQACYHDCSFVSKCVFSHNHPMGDLWDDGYIISIIRYRPALL